VQTVALKHNEPGKPGKMIEIYKSIVGVLCRLTHCSCERLTNQLCMSASLAKCTMCLSRNSHTPEIFRL